MTYDEDQENAMDIANAALARLQHDHVAPIPLHYEVWYAYYAGGHPELKKGMDLLMKSRPSLAPSDLRDFHDQFLSDRKKQEAVQRASDQIHATLNNVTTLMHNVKEATDEYSTTLNDVSQKIASVKTPEEIQAVLNSIADDTNRMMVFNNELQRQLEQSATAMEVLKRDMERVRQEAMTDSLTGLANRKAFDEHIVRLRKNAAESGHSFTLLLVDIDHFKSFNDNYGHQVGDQVLRLVARTLTDGVKGRDIAARYGGEEFIILLPETNLDAGIAVANSLRKALANKEIINRNNGQLLGRITMSVGVAQYYENESIEGLIERADSALYTAKNNGRNQVAAAPTPHDRFIQAKI